MITHKTIAKGDENFASLRRELLQELEPSNLQFHPFSLSMLDFLNKSLNQSMNESALDFETFKSHPFLINKVPTLAKFPELFLPS